MSKNGISYPSAKVDVEWPHFPKINQKSYYRNIYKQHFLRIPVVTASKMTLDVHASTHIYKLDLLQINEQREHSTSKGLDWNV